MAVDLEIDGAQSSSTSRRAENVGERGGSGSGRGGTCRRRGTPGRLGGDGGRSGQQHGGGGVAGDAPPRRHGVVAVRLGVELRLLLGCSWVERGGRGGGVE